MRNTRQLTISTLIAGMLSFGYAHAADMTYPSEAPSGVQVWAEVYGGLTSLSSKTGTIGPNEDPRYGIVGGSATLMTTYGLWGLQLDVFGESNTDGTSAPIDDTYKGAFGGGLHVNSAVSDQVILGVFGAVAGVGIQDTDGSDRDTTAYIVGAEGSAQFSIGRFDPIVYLQAGYLDSDRDSDDAASIRRAGFVRGGVKTALTDRITWISEYSYASGRMDVDNDRVTLFGWGTRVEFDARDVIPAPVRFFVEYDGTRYRQSAENDKITDHTVVAGISVDLGGNQNRDLNRHFDLPRFYRWVGQTGGPLE